jgi:protein TonB
MLITLRDLSILATVIGIHIFLFIYSLQNSTNKNKEIDILQAEFINSPPPLAPKTLPPPPSPKTPTPKLLSVTPAQKSPSSKQEELTKPIQAQKSEPIIQNKSETSLSSESSRTQDPISNTSNTKSNSPIGLDAGKVELNQLTMIYRPETELFYPRLSKDIGEQGVVDVQLFINELGEVKSVNVTHSSGYERLDKAATQLASRVRFKPYLMNGIPSKVNAGISIKFQLNR